MSGSVLAGIGVWIVALALFLLTPPVGAEPGIGLLDYFVYPHVEVGGERFDGPIDREFSYTLVEPGETKHASH